MCRGPTPFGYGPLDFCYLTKSTTTVTCSSVGEAQRRGEPLLRPQSLEVDEPRLDPGVSLRNRQTLRQVAFAPTGYDGRDDWERTSPQSPCCAESPEPRWLSHSLLLTAQDNGDHGGWSQRLPILPFPPGQNWCLESFTPGAGSMSGSARKRGEAQ